MARTPAILVVSIIFGAILITTTNGNLFGGLLGGQHDLLGEGGGLLNTGSGLLGGMKKVTSGEPLSGVLGGAAKVLGLNVLEESDFSLVPSANELAKIDPGLLKVLSLSSQAVSNCLVTFGGNEEVIQSIESQRFGSILEKRQALVKGLKAHAEKKQSSGKSVLSLLNVDKFQSFWIANTMIVSEADLNIVSILSMLTDVDRIRLVPEIKLNPLISPLASLQNAINSGMNPQWGVSRVDAPLVWDAGVNGNGVVVSTIDSGVRGTHESLAPCMRDRYNWFDPYEFSSSPKDENGHGTHTMGTICGQNGIGVAPGAKWMACRGCSSSSCEGNALYSCGEFIMEPTDVNGINPNTAMAPDVVSNSWGSLRGNDDWYNPVVAAWTCGGILSVFANGNLGPGCISSGSPGDQDTVFSVGATDFDNNLASFSSKGPSGLFLQSMKPDISAPGKNVYSCWNTADNSYNTISGTSMATPHVAGVMALMLCAKRTQIQDSSSVLSMDTVTSTIKQAALRDGLTVIKGGAPCDVPSLEGNFPNNQYGYGLCNAYNSVFLALS